MSRRAVALATAALACLGAFAVSTAPAQASAARSAGAIDVVYSPLSLGEYCAAKVNSTSNVGFYNSNLSCYYWSGSGQTYTGSGSPSAACVYFNPTYTYLGYAQGGSQALICKYSV